MATNITSFPWSERLTWFYFEQMSAKHTSLNDHLQRSVSLFNKNGSQWRRAADSMHNSRKWMRSSPGTHKAPIYVPLCHTEYWSLLQIHTWGTQMWKTGLENHLSHIKQELSLGNGMWKTMIQGTLQYEGCFTMKIHPCVHMIMRRNMQIPKGLAGYTRGWLCLSLEWQGGYCLCFIYLDFLVLLQ